VNAYDWVHECGATLELTHTCKACGGEVTGSDLRSRLRDAETSAA
jgi:hypothetical protein